MKRNCGVFLACTGLGHINRGYESFARECFQALKDSTEFELFLIKGGGESKANEIVLPNLPRQGKAALWLGKLLNKEPYLVEQFTFCISMLPLILLKRPAVIYYSDFILGTYLWHLRKILKFRYKLLFSNGAPNGPPYKTEDHVQQLLPFYLNQAIKKGEPASKQTLLPYGFNIDLNDRLSNIEKRGSIRQELGFADDQKIILSVGAINKHHKRMDYIINEVEKLPKEYFLIILGQFEKETTELINLAINKLAGRHFIANVPHEEVENYYLAADYFVLASLTEGFGRVLIEALSYGLMCIVHDYTNARQVLREYGTYINMTKEGSLAFFLAGEPPTTKRTDLIQTSHRLYSWDKLRYEYTEMICNLIKR